MRVGVDREEKPAEVWNDEHDFYFMHSAVQEEEFQYEMKVTQTSLAALDLPE